MKKYAHEILIVTGTRPEIIKMAPVYQAFKNSGHAIDWCHTGQHDSLAAQTFAVFGIQPDVVFERPAGTGLPALLGGLVNHIDQQLSHKTYQCVLVHGDTSSTLAGALAAFYHQVPVIGHVEAGLRSGDLHHPFPEELNRVLVAKIANRHFAPTRAAELALLQEGVSGETILVTGNTAIDAQQYLLASGTITAGETNQVLVTAHRRENWAAIPTICTAIKALSQQQPDLTFMVATHPNPAVKQAVMTGLADCPAASVVPPLDYVALQQVLAQSALVLTDSGGIQEEAPTFGTRVVVLRETTERPEALAMGLSQLAGATDVARIVSAAELLLAQGRAKGVINPYGSGQAARLIAEAVQQVFDELV
ncbi:non-hydrolyzing UDP-N-acetylglucosamine 2-epimerase [Photobacterium sp. TY1-4]|uniref:non-hydrolyzing UDP-N-acetylglucosamine 2-epimerase n=1 Tax=Photobacterium sp. TY1-4 TaxID=2899122 RepID=UPI0021C0F30B|nr:UDP-N-acetylglucosamine 2-epimerase (non-hydrolyzing) [Photobacterium sp. TY1-4]UXI00139.1 UDP-N-acetylglucosamine 2-epimerase (non-hydrolyzing) [Photobacterium sp. TY1-4]